MSSTGRTTRQGSLEGLARDRLELFAAPDLTG